LEAPLQALDGVAFSWPGFDSPPSQLSLSPIEIQRLALLNRIDLRRQLAQYAATDEALKLEIAKQYPDVNLAGGYSWEGGENIFELGPSSALPVFNHNQGPIAEAEARRREVAAQFLAMQAGIIEQSQTTLTRYRGALGALEAARSAAELQAKRLGQARRAIGESDTVRNQRVVIRTEGQSVTPDRLGEAVVGYQDGASVRLRDVAHVLWAPAPAIGAALIQGKPGVIVQLSTQFGASQRSPSYDCRSCARGSQACSRGRRNHPSPGPVSGRKLRPRPRSATSAHRFFWAAF
jgi:hypothetical protein